MTQPFSVNFLFFLAFAAITLIVIAAATWLTVPRWIAARLAVGRDKSELEVEDNYRTALGQIISFPLAFIGALAASVAGIQAVGAYRQSQEVAYQDQYRRGFDALGATSMGTRIGGLYTLKTLIDADSVASAGDTKNGEDRSAILLRALAAFAVEQPANPGEIVHPDALTALQIVAFRSSQPELGLDFRTGKFPGAIVADGPSQHYAAFSNSDFYKADLHGSGFYRADFSTANLREVDLSGANLAGAKLNSAGLSGATFCPGLNFAVPEMMHAGPVRTAASSAQFNDSYGEGTRFDGAVLDGSTFVKARLLAPSFANAFLYHAQFAESVLENSDFSSADLKGASFEGATIVDPVFDGAVLIDTNFRAASGIVSEASLSNANAIVCNVIMPSGEVIAGDCTRAEQAREKLRAIQSPKTICKRETAP
ncbi:pentapeptide repeat-containing protein [Mesorhizobium sp. M0482]|uniref:pentapeptide repeat-containing protein n=1 Tax=Mesorhizobium sp. M0482 TaxID=2956948 RepID=UPI00333C1AE4